MPKQTNKKPQTIPVYGSANQIVDDLHKMANEKLQNAQTQLQNSPLKTPTLNQPTSQPTANHRSLVLICLFVIFASAITLVLINKLNLNPVKPALAINTLQDQNTSQKIKEITGYGWNEIQKGQTGKTEEKLAALLLLHEEESWIFQKYNSLISAKYLQTSQLSALKEVDEDPNKQNIKFLLENLIESTKVYGKIKVPEAETHQNRLEVLEYYFAKYELSPSDAIPTQADVITLNTHPAQSQQDLMKLLINRNNNWLETVQNTN